MPRGKPTFPSSLSYEVYGGAMELVHPDTKAAIPENFVCKFSEVRHKDWDLTMETDDIVLYKGKNGSSQVKVIVHLRASKMPDGTIKSTRTTSS